MKTIGVALSGGGHRATVWAFGALLYLTDANQHRRVSTVASISGGSIANGVLAKQVDYTTVDGAQLRAAIAPALRHLAEEGLFFFGPATNRYVYTILAFAGLTALAFFVTVVVSVAVTGWVVVASALATALVLGATIVLASRRSTVTDHALAKVHFGGTTLAELDRRVEHVFCATELQAGNHIFFAPRFVYGYRHGVGTPEDLRLSTAVQCSACLPGAFAPRRLPAARHGFEAIPGVSDPPQPPKHLVVNDGGVYDNMGEEWFAGYADRVRGWPDLPSMCPETDELVIVNSSGGWGWLPLEKWSILRRELVGVMRSKDVLYNTSTRIRRRDLIQTFSANARLGQRPTGALVHIPQSPFTTADGFRSGTDPRSARAEAVIDALGDTDLMRKRWADIARRNTGVKTVLRKLGAEDTSRLLYHAYVLAMSNLHVVLNYPLLPTPTEADFRFFLGD